MPLPKKMEIQKIKKQGKVLQQEVALYQSIMEGMRKDLEFDEILKLLITSVTRGLGYDRAGIFLLQPDGLTLELAMGIDTVGKFEKGTYTFKIIDSPNKDPFSSIMFQYKQFFLSNNIPKRRGATGSKLNSVDAKVLNHAIAPLEIGRDKIIGLLAVDNLFKPRFITKVDIAVLLNFATQAGLSIESYRLHEKITNLTITDPLTNIYNRRYFEQALFSELKRSERYARPCGLLYVDVDHFKAVNDKWGHAVGDDVLKQVAYTLRTGVRNIDTVSRIGGEEFAVILPETPREGTKLAGNRLVEAMADSSLSTQMERVTISVGVACFPESAKDPDQLKLKADKSLYEAKNTGRNKVGPFLDS